MMVRLGLGAQPKRPITLHWERIWAESIPGSSSNQAKWIGAARLASPTALEGPSSSGEYLRPPWPPPGKNSPNPVKQTLSILHMFHRRLVADSEVHCTAASSYFYDRRQANPALLDCRGRRQPRGSIRLLYGYYNVLWNSARLS